MLFVRRAPFNRTSHSRPDKKIKIKIQNDCHLYVRIYLQQLLRLSWRIVMRTNALLRMLAEKSINSAGVGLVGLDRFS
jgi:hypothetical protein